jgi:hypothetical protein
VVRSAREEKRKFPKKAPFAFWEIYLFHSELTTAARQEKRKWFDQLVKKKGNFPERRPLPFGEIYLFHSELTTVARQEKRKWFDQLVKKIKK